MSLKILKKSILASYPRLYNVCYSEKEKERNCNETKALTKERSELILGMPYDLT
jgi:hypothetical protein